MPTLSSYINVFGTALQVLKDKGYQLWFQPDTNLYYAERDGWDFAGDSPCDLLGIVAIFEHVRPQRYKEYWWRTGDIDTRSLPDAPAPYASVLSTQRDPNPEREAFRQRWIAATKVLAADPTALVDCPHCGREK